MSATQSMDEGQRMSTCDYCFDDGHTIDACPHAGKEPWAKEPDARWHTKIVTEDDGTGAAVERHVSCNCQFFDEGEEHYDFDGL